MHAMPVFLTVSCISTARIAGRLALVAAVCAAFSACSTFDRGSRGLAGIITPYKTDVVQGNFVSKEQKDALQIGMPRAQVRDILGSPLVTSVFHADRWEYVFTIRRQGQEPQQRKLTVFFKGDELARVDSDELISEEDFVTSLSASRRLGKVPLLEVPADVLREFGLKSSASNATSNTAVNAANTASNAPNLGANTVYPPLEVGAVAASSREVNAPRAAAPSVAAPPAPVQTAPPAPAPVQTAPAPQAAVPVAPAAPAAAPSLPADATITQNNPEISAFLGRWANDWQSRNAAAYFSHYVPEFKGTSASRAEWEASRRTRIEGRSRISVVTSDVRMRVVSPTEARLVFRQVYDSDTFKEVGTKAMLLIKRDGRWLIEREFFTPSQ